MSSVHARNTLHFITFSDSLYDNQWRPSFHFWLKDRPCRLFFSWYADLLAFLFSVDKSIGSGCFFPGLDPSVNLIGYAAITEMIKLQFTITDRIRNKIRNGNWFPKFSINKKEQKFLPICLRLLTLLTIIKDPSS